jgi:hypothetical protein
MVYFRAHMSFQALDDDDDEEEPFGDEAAIEHTKTDTIAAAVVQPLLQALETFGCTSKDQQPPQDDSSVAIFKDREPPQGFFLRCMRCLGSFSLVDGCILVLAGQRACALLAAGLRQWRGAPEAVACGLEVLSNLAAIEDDELDEQVHVLQWCTCKICLKFRLERHCCAVVMPKSRGPKHAMLRTHRASLTPHMFSLTLVYSGDGVPHRRRWVRSGRRSAHSVRHQRAHLARRLRGFVQFGQRFGRGRQIGCAWGREKCVDGDSKFRLRERFGEMKIIYYTDFVVCFFVRLIFVVHFF